jgi:hypothetical protein
VGRASLRFAAGHDLGREKPSKADYQLKAAMHLLVQQPLIGARRGLAPLDDLLQDCQSLRLHWAIADSRLEPNALVLRVAVDDLFSPA